MVHKPVIKHCKVILGVYIFTATQVYLSHTIRVYVYHAGFQFLNYTKPFNKWVGVFAIPKYLGSLSEHAGI